MLFGLRSRLARRRVRGALARLRRPAPLPTRDLVGPSRRAARDYASELDGVVASLLDDTIASDSPDLADPQDTAPHVPPDPDQVHAAAAVISEATRRRREADQIAGASTGPQSPA